MADETETPGDDVVQQDGGRWHLPDWHPSRGAQVSAAVALVIGLASRIPMCPKARWTSLVVPWQVSKV